MTDIVEIAKDIAKQAHAGQTYGRDNPQPYFDAHVMKVAERVRAAGYSDKYIAVAILHDVVEDTDVTLQDLYDRGMPPEVVFGVEAMTHREDESYVQYVFRAGENPHARVVKYHDMTENLSNNPTKRQVMKYTFGLDIMRCRFPNDGFDNVGQD